MSKKGVRYFRRGPNGRVKVGFFNNEIVVAVLGKYPEGLTVKEVSDKSNIHYNTARHILFQLVELNRVTVVSRKVKKRQVVKHYLLTPWRIE